ncbi:KdsC family phosphatase [Pseudoxanthomonas dokdonensis]|uniref:3-deoxy-D-manno-octulosonate 8-phosphate phosphatase KdsC n=1 Tax=Pseudoxanthomonas dokdonensis TaxID=344882 RepID=A0A0R0CPV2_9GAMM|nr:HAD family hydrolase [Pseudoxanthomonas dokdonensis]KRG67975.1 3-deoxy-D-manno-octulosonate 8-phosphate phosphatase [Pseudoxanthomonas dokdonensis]
MNRFPFTSLSPDLQARAAAIRLLCLDVDGTLTDGRLYLDEQGCESKAFHVHDGQGMVLLRRAGIDVVLITARHSPVAHRRGQELGIAVMDGVKDKLSQVQALAAEQGLTLSQVAFMGDDLADLPSLRAVGLALAPADAHPWTAQSAHWQSTANGGQGAVREACDLILAAQGRVEEFFDGSRS